MVFFSSVFVIQINKLTNTAGCDGRNVDFKINVVRQEHVFISRDFN